MNNNTLWNDAAAAGAKVGALLSISFLIESVFTLSGNMTLYTLMIVEWLAVVCLHYMLLHRYTRKRRTLFTKDEGFSFGQGYSFILVTSAFAGVILGVVTYIYQFIIIGWEKFTDLQIEAMTKIVSVSGGVNQSVEAMLLEMIKGLKAAPEPTILQIVMGGIMTSIMFGAFYGLIIAGTSARQPQPFSDTTNEEENE